MKWYFASRTRHTEKLVAISKFLESRGETIASDWVYVGSLAPFEANLKKVQEIGEHNTKQILGSDIFVLVSDAEGTDMFVELGTALAKAATAPGSIKIYIIGEHSKRSLIQLHPVIIHLPTLKDVFEKEGVDFADFEVPELN